MRTALREEALELRLKGDLSYTEIRKRLGVPKSTLSYWLHEFPLSEEKIQELKSRGLKNGEAGRERFRVAMRQKQEQKDQDVYALQKTRMANLSRDALFVAGLMLYLGEGGKKDRSKLTLANTDPEIITFFVWWLNEFLGIAKSKLRAALHLYENMEIKKEYEFWKKHLGFEDSQFYKTQIRELQKSSFSYRESFRHGTCSIYVGGVDEHREVMMGIKAFLEYCKENNKGA